MIRAIVKKMEKLMISDLIIIDRGCQAFHVLGLFSTYDTEADCITKCLQLYGAIFNPKTQYWLLGILDLDLVNMLQTCIGMFIEPLNC